MASGQRDAGTMAVQIDDRLGECRYGDWTGQPLRKLSRDPLWRVVQAHPSAVRFPGPDGESMTAMQQRAVAAIREWNEKLGKDATYLVCSHGDVIKAILADALGMHLDMSQRIQVDPCSLSVIRYTSSAAVCAADERHRRGRRRAGRAGRPPGTGAGRIGCADRRGSGERRRSESAGSLAPVA